MDPISSLIFDINFSRNIHYRFHFLDQILASDARKTRKISELLESPLYPRLRIDILLQYNAPDEFRNNHYLHSDKYPGLEAASESTGQNLALRK